MRLNPGAFSAFLSGNIGQLMLWRSNTICPCVNSFSNSANPKCPKCAGKGRIWAAPVEARAGMTRQQIDVNLSQQVNWEMGDATLTVDESSPMYDAGQFDRITLLNSTDRFSLVLVRGQPAERLFMKVDKIDDVFWYTGQDGQGTRVQGGIPVVADDGTLTWASGAPPVGKEYAITGTRFAEYFLYLNLPSDRAEHFGARLPKLMRARRFELFGR